MYFATRRARGGNRVARFALAAIALAWVSCAADAPVDARDPARADLRVAGEPSAPIPSNPPFLRVEGRGGADLALFGTIHVGPPTGWVFPAWIERTIRDADAFLFEVDLRALDEETVSQAMMRHGILPPRTPLSTLIDAETAALIASHAETLARVGAPAPVREAMRPWLITMLLAEHLFEQGGLTSAQAVERQLLALIGDREVLALETLDQQFAFFSDMPFELQELMLRYALEDWDDAPETLARLVEAWRTNDQATILELTYEGIDDHPRIAEFHAAILDDRNRAWVPQLVALLEDPARAETTILVAVGAGHLVGPDGVPSLLEAAGYAPLPPSLRVAGTVDAIGLAHE